MMMMKGKKMPHKPFIAVTGLAPTAGVNYLLEVKYFHKGPVVVTVDHDTDHDEVTADLDQTGFYIWPSDALLSHGPGTYVFTATQDGEAVATLTQTV